MKKIYMCVMVVILIFGLSACSSGIITPEEAKEIAATEAGVEVGDVSFTRVTLDEDENVYECEFSGEGYIYYYEIDATKGEVVSFGKSEIDTVSGASDTVEEHENESFETKETLVTEDEAKSIAVNHGGYTMAEVTFTEIKWETENNVEYFEIDYTTPSDKFEHSVEVNSNSGEVIDYEKESI